MMTVPSQLEGAQIGGNLTLTCKSEAFPASINYWVRGERSETVSSSSRMKTTSLVQDHVTLMKLEIFDVQHSDITSYRCVAKNSLGETDGRIKLYGDDDVSTNNFWFLKYLAIEDPKVETTAATTTTTTEMTTHPHRYRHRTRRPTRRPYTYNPIYQVSYEGT